MKISIVTGTYNRYEYLLRMMESARAQIPHGITLEFVIVDGGSTDNTLEYLKAQNDVVLIEHGALLGVQKSFCDGAKAATGDYVVIANDDIRFLDSGLITAMVYLENNPTCGAVAFADNRSGRGYHQSTYDVQWQPAYGEVSRVIYAQVGMYPKAVGDAADWWGADDPDFEATSYGVDNYLSSRIWEMGYSIDAVEGCRVHDEIANDALRDKMNSDNTNSYFKRFPRGAFISGKRKERAGKRHLRVLYLPIYEPGHAVQKTQKRGLRESLKSYGRGQWVWEFDYMASRDIYNDLLKIVRQFKPDLMVSQIQDASVLTTDEVRYARAHSPNMVWVNWNGDYAWGGLTSERMLALLREIDLQLVVNAGALDEYSKQGINAAHWQIGYEETPDGLKHKPHDVVFLGNCYAAPRRILEAELLTIPDVDLGLYGSGWQHASGNTLYDFDAGAAIYQNAKIALGDNMYPDGYGFVSNRIFQALAAGGAMLLHQSVPGLEETTGLKDTVHYVAWSDTDDLKAKIAYYLEHDLERESIAANGMRFVRMAHSFDVRVMELFTRLLPQAKRQPYIMYTVDYIGTRTSSFGVRVNNWHYTITPGKSILVRPMDKPYFDSQSELYRVSIPESP